MNKNSEHSLTGKLLLAMPGLGDPRFYRAVIFMCAHDEKGAMGLVINHVLPGIEFKSLLEQLRMSSDIRIDLANLDMPVLCGGPVEAARGFILHSRDFSQKDTVTVGDAYGITGTVEALKVIAGGGGPDRLLFLLGYAGWGPGQLDREIQENSWLVADPDPNIIFHAAPDEKWTMAVQKLGFDPGMLSSVAGRA
ncbi:MAG: YqgE/AlgH family protein [Alphaproteobacteria bacterium]